VGFPFKTSKLKNDINFKYKFSHRFGKVCKGLNIYYSKIIIIIIFKITTKSIWIILKNLVWICRECKNCRKWTTWLCIYPLATKMLLKDSLELIHVCCNIHTIWKASGYASYIAYLIGGVGHHVNHLQ
jgi:hypothetical protein